MSEAVQGVSRQHQQVHDQGVRGQYLGAQIVTLGGEKREACQQADGAYKQVAVAAQQPAVSRPVAQLPPERALRFAR